MNKLCKPRLSWIWKKDNITYKAMLYRDTFTVRNANINGSIILRIKNLTTDSQKNIIESMHAIKKKTDVTYNG